MSDYEVRSIDELPAINDGLTRLAGAELGTESFGMQVFEFPPSFEGYPEHDHGEQNQEEVYVILAGSGEIELNGSRHSLAPGTLVRVAPATRRKLWPGPDGLRVLAIGSVIGGEYERPAGLSLPADS